jgi:hypothetical protein
VESLAFIVTLIVAPAMFGGPIGLLLTVIKVDNLSRVRRNTALVLCLLSSVSGAFLVSGSVSRGATLIGLLGLVSGTLGLLRIWRLQKTS